MGLPGVRSVTRAAKKLNTGGGPDWVYVRSSNVKAMRMYREASLRSEREAYIEIWFKNGMIYTYLADGRTYAALVAASSKGRAVHRLLVPRGYVKKRSAS